MLPGRSYFQFPHPCDPKPQGAWARPEEFARSGRKEAGTEGNWRKEARETVQGHKRAVAGGPLEGSALAVRTAGIDEKLERTGYEILMARSSGIVGGSHHHSGLEITLVHSGAMEFTRGGASKRLAGGELALLVADEPHSTRALQRSYYRTSLHFDPARLPGTAGVGLLSRLQDSGGILFLSMNPQVGSRFLWACRQLELLGKAPPGERDETARYLLGMIAADVAQLASSSPRVSTAPVLWEIAAYMERHVGRRERLEDLAKRFFLSPDNLLRLFRKHLGVSPYQYWLGLKLDRALEALSGDATVQEIAGALGFESLSGFERAFKRRFGMTPTEYRRALNSGESRGKA